MEAQTETEKGKGTRGRGRMDANRQPATKQPKIVADGIEELVTLYDRAKTATDKSNDAIAAIAEKSGFLASAVRKLVVAKATDKYEETKRLIEQQMDLFETAGE